MRGKNGIIHAMNNRDKSALALALAIVGGIAAGMRYDASEWMENSSQYTPRPAAYTVKHIQLLTLLYHDSETEHGTIPDKQDEWNKKYE